MLAEEIEIPVIIGGKEVRTGDTAKAVCPHDHKKVLATYHQAGAAEVAAAAAAAKTAWKEWSETSWDERASILIRAADLLAGPWRDTLNGATMLNQSKTVLQAEIDSACEMIDFWRVNPYFMRELYTDQPWSSPGTWNRVDYRPLEGFVFAVSPFNFTSIGGNLPTAPALMGNTVLWKPASTAVYSNYFIMKLLQAAGFPDGVINFLPGKASKVGDPALAHADLAGIHFTGSTPVFQSMWKTIGANIASYRNYPRIVGETGGKDFIVAHRSADVDALAVACVRGAYEYQGQKCSAASRLYVPRSLWPALKDRLVAMTESVVVGDPTLPETYVGAVINARQHAKHVTTLAEAREKGLVVAGGNTDDSVGWFVDPTVLEVTDPHSPFITEEIFAPVLTAYVYEDGDWEQTLKLVDSSTRYGLTGAVFAQDRTAVEQADAALRYAAGNFYVNDKPTGSVVGQQPFGGARASGTNDKAGTVWNMIRFASPRATKENHLPVHDYRYPHLDS
jgi:1-pyrroline-5-carboxylate dehydrogenase